MKEIRIGYLVLENFKCHAYLKLDLRGRNASVVGDNGVGKTSIYDGLTWLLFGKDSRSNSEKSLDLKPLDKTGAVKDHRAVTAVEAQLLVDGEPLVLRRTLRESWVMRRGSRQEVYEGNTSEFFIDGVPMKKSAFDARVGQLVPEDLFRLLTSVSCFADQLSWQQRRSLLFDMAGTMTDRQLMETEPRFAFLLEAVGDGELRECRARALQEKKGLTGLREDTPARIQECQRILRELEGVDYAACDAREEALEQELEELAAWLRETEQDTAAEKKRLELQALRLQEAALTRGVEPAYLRQEIQEEQRHLQALELLLDKARQELTHYDGALAQNRQQWVKINGEAFAGGICPACGQALPFDRLKEATASFEAGKRRRLQESEAEQTRLEQARQRTESRMEDLQQEQQRRDKRIRQLEGRLREDAERPELTALRQQIRDAEAEIAAMEKGTRELALPLEQRREALREQLRQVRKTQAGKELGQQTRQRVAQLEQEAERAREALESIETLLFAMEDFVRFKAERMERSVNGLFRLARFRLFREQANGALEERCDVLCGGVPYLGLNNGARVNVGIDIINTLSRHYGVRVPLFVDNAEAVTKLEECDCQVVRLVVGRGELTVES